MVRTSVQGWLSPAPGSLGWGPIVARLPSFGQVPPSTLPDFFLAKLMPRLPTRPPRRIPLVTPTLLSSLICRADCRCRDGVVSPALAPPQDWPCAAPGPTQPGSQESPARDHPGEGPHAPMPRPVRPHCFTLSLFHPPTGVPFTSTASTSAPRFKPLRDRGSFIRGPPPTTCHVLTGFEMGWLRPSLLAPSSRSISPTSESAFSRPSLLLSVT